MTGPARQPSYPEISPWQSPPRKKPGSQADEAQASRAARPDRSTWIAGGIVLALVLWMGSGFVFPAEEEEQVVRDEPVAPVAVSVRRIASAAGGAGLHRRRPGPAGARYGLCAPRCPARSWRSKRSAVTASAKVPSSARFNDEERAAARAQAEAELERAERELEQAETLLDRGTGTLDRVVNARTARAAADAALVSARRARASYRDPGRFRRAA